MKPRFIPVPRRRGMGQVSFSDTTNPGAYQVGDSWSLQISGATPNAPVVVNAQQGGQPASQSQQGTTDANGNFSKTGTFNASTVGSWWEQWIVGSLVVGTISFTVVAAPSGNGAASSPTPTTAAIQNTSRPGQPLQVGDTWSVTVHGAANSPVTATVQQSGQSASSSNFGSTDSNGNFSLSGTADSSTVGSWTETWAVAGVNASPFTFTVSAVSGQGSGSGSGSSATSQTPSAPASCFQPLAQYGIPDPCLGPIGLGTLAAGVIGLMILGSFIGGHR